MKGPGTTSNSNRAQLVVYSSQMISKSPDPPCYFSAETTDGIFKLLVDSSPSLPPAKSNWFIRLDGHPFKSSAIPCVVGPRWHASRHPLPTGSSPGQFHVWRLWGTQITRQLNGAPGFARMPNSKIRVRECSRGSDLSARLIKKKLFSKARAFPSCGTAFGSLI
jgi:hypothetical protein